MQPIKSKILIFDLDGTLYRLVGPSNQYRGSLLEKTVLANTKSFLQSRNLVKNNIELESVMSSGLQDPVGLSSYIASNFGLTRGEYFDEVWNINPQGIISDFQESVETITELYKSNTLILLTSSARVWQKNVCKYLGITSLFSQIFTGEDFKSKDQVFKKLQEKYKESVITSIGDQIETDINPAKKLGFNTLWIKSPTEIIKLLKGPLCKES